MIFVILGSQKFQFNRLLKEIDCLIDKGVIHDQVFAQTGASTYIPKNYAYMPYIEREQFQEYEAEADLIITHGGTGAVIGAVKKGKKVIAVPRLSEYGEHVDDHQLQLIREFDSMGIILPCYDLRDLESVYRNVNNAELKPFRSAQMDIINSIDAFLTDTQAEKSHDY